MAIAHYENHDTHRNKADTPKPDDSIANYRNHFPAGSASMRSWHFTPESVIRPAGAYRESFDPAHSTVTHRLVTVA